MEINQDFFVQAINILCSRLYIIQTMDTFFHFLNRHMPVEWIELVIYDQELKTLKNFITTTKKTIENKQIMMPLPKTTQEFIENADLSKPLIINDLKSEEIFAPMLELVPDGIDIPEDRKLSQIGLALLIEGKWIGNLGITAIGINQFTQEHADLIAPLQEPLALIMSNSLQYKENMRLQELLADQNRYLQQELRGLTTDVIGRNYGLKHVMEAVALIASKENPVMLFGETGTGKEVIANAIHFASPRRTGPFIKVNCGAIPDSLIDSELFGHEKGAFTGALGRKKGRFERANNGTIFLDEIGELPLAAQVRLLRVIQNKEIERVGGSETIPLDIRFITATHQDLTEMAAKGDFREDLLFRINVFPIVIPPLRERKVDIPELVNHFIQLKARELKIKEIPKLSPGSMDPLIAYNWPGNVRELENVVERALIHYDSGPLTLDDFLNPKSQGKPPLLSVENSDFLSFDDMTRKYIASAIRHCNGRISGPKGAADLLGMHRNTLRSKMEKLGINNPKNRLQPRNL